MSGGDRPGRLMLLDSASLYFRAFFGVPDRRQAPGEPNTTAVRGFLDMVASLLTMHRPTHLVACWDDDWRPQFRVAAIPSYKSHRLAPGSQSDELVPDELSPQVPVIAELLRALGIARVGCPGYEADDVIGTLATRARGAYPVDVVTGDRDLFQLVDDEGQVRVIYTARGGVREADVVTQAYLRDRYAVATGRAYADMAVLRGDSSDGLPGVPGIGEKTAAALIARYGDLAAVRRAVGEGDPLLKGAQRVRLEAAGAYLDVAPAVVQVARDAPVEDVDATLPRSVVDGTALVQVASSYGVTSNVNRVLRALDLEPLAGSPAPPLMRPTVPAASGSPGPSVLAPGRQD